MALSCDLVVGCWNMHGFNSAQFYVENVLDRFDVLALSKHWLFGEQLHKISNYSCDFTGHGIASQSNPDILSGRGGHGGVGILWSTAFNDFASPLSIDSDRINGVKLTTPDHQSLFILAVYLPSSNHPTDTFQKTLDLLWAVHDHICNQGITVILGDFNGALGYLGGDNLIRTK